MEIIRLFLFTTVALCFALRMAASVLAYTSWNRRPRWEHDPWGPMWFIFGTAALLEYTQMIGGYLW